MNSLNALLTFGDDSEVGSRRLQPMPQPIYDQVTIKENVQGQ